MSSVANTIFLKTPQVLYVDEDYSVKAPAYSSIDGLIRSLQENGPLVAVGRLGPGAYTEAPFKLKDRVGDVEVYGWKPHTFQACPVSTAIILGAKQTESNAYVYYTLATDITRDNRSLIRGFKPLDTDAKVYVMSYDNFLKRSLVDLHPICPHGQWLFSVPVDSILVDAEILAKCKQIGQQIFDHYKAAAKGDSDAGRNAVIRICEAAKVLTHDGAVRKGSIERAWGGVGDTNWRWQC